LVNENSWLFVSLRGWVFCVGKNEPRSHTNEHDQNSYTTHYCINLTWFHSWDDQSLRCSSLDAWQGCGSSLIHKPATSLEKHKRNVEADKESIQTNAMTFASHFLLGRHLKFSVFGFLLALFLATAVVVRSQPRTSATAPRTVLLQIVRAEDERRWDDTLLKLLSHRDSAVRSRAALAAGRIGNELALPALISLMRDDKDPAVRSMAIFALGEIESPKAVEALTAELGEGDRR